jgi:hypothetical protein
VMFGCLLLLQLLQLCCFFRKLVGQRLLIPLKQAVFKGWTFIFNNDNEGVPGLLRIQDNAVMLNDQVITATPASI